MKCWPGCGTIKNRHASLLVENWLYKPVQPHGNCQYILKPNLCISYDFEFQVYTENDKKTFTRMFITLLFIIIPNYTLHKCPSRTNGQRNDD